MAVEMVYVDERNAQAQRHALGEARAYKERAYEPRAAREGYGREVADLDAGAAQGCVDHGHDVLLMRARGQLGHHAAVLFMYLLRCYHIAPQDAVDDDRSRRIVARRFYT